MKLWFVRLTGLALVGAAAVWAWGWLFPSPERLIRQELLAVANAASIGPNEPPLTRLAKTQKLLSYFANDAQISVDVPGRSVQTFNGRDELQQAALGARSMLNNLRVAFVDIVVSVAPDKKSAVADLTATATLPGEKIPEVQELEVRFSKIDHDWLIHQVETVKTLR